MSEFDAGRTLYVDLDRVGLRRDGRALRLHCAETADVLVPLSRVDRAMVSGDVSGVLDACLAVIERGGTVHFTDGAGRLRALLQDPRAQSAQAHRELARQIAVTASTTPFRRWRDTQRRHAWSLVFRRNFCGDFDANRKRLVRYLLYFRNDAPVQDELDWLEHQTAAWLQSEIQRTGLLPTQRELQKQDADMFSALMSCLLLPLIWHYVIWRRHRERALVSERVEFFELQARVTLARQMRRHVDALHHSYHTQRAERAPGRPPHNNSSDA